MSCVTETAALPLLPREVAASEAGEDVRRLLGLRVLALGPAGARPLVAVGPVLVETLRRALGQGRLDPGLEPAEASLEQERAGLRAADARSGRPRTARISRLALVSRDVSPRFQRRLARLAERHADRLLVVVLDAEGAEVGRALFGRPKQTRLLLVSHKRAVADVLLALARDASDARGAG